MPHATASEPATDPERPAPSGAAPGAASAPSLQDLRNGFRARKAAILEAAGRPGATGTASRRLLGQLARLTDELLQALWDRAGFPATFALAAVGGYGRGQLFPYSDVDVLVLLPDGTATEDDPALRERLETFIGSCWDTGLEIGSSVRTVAQCLAEAAQDITVQTSLLEARCLTGCDGLFRDFSARFHAAIDPKAFFASKMLEMRQRHQKFDDTPYALEPNCKESPGGLRDLQVILWVARAAGYGNSWDALARNGLATAFEQRQLKRHEALLNLIRIRLHLVARRREDRLVFDLQTAVAESFGYHAADVGDGRGAVRVSEAIMRRYYWSAKAVTQLNQVLLLNIDERLNPTMHTARPINERFFDKAGMVEVASDDLYQREPHAILETFLLYQMHAELRGLSARTLRALYNARDLMDSAFRRDPANRATFLRILQQPRGITHVFRLMNQTSVLGRYLWVFRNTVGQMQHDLFHVYTVDQHIMMVLRNMRRFFMPEHAHEYPFCSQLAAGFDKPWLLYAAALFHDIAKGRGGDHSELGALDVQDFCRDHGVDGEDEEMIVFLVREHLTMSRVAQKADLSDPEVIAQFAATVRDERHLAALYLLTVADIRGTSPKVWNAWKGKLLEDLYRYTQRTLGNGAPDREAEVDARKREALALLKLQAQPFEAHKALWKTLDIGYFMRHDATELAWHVRHLSRGFVAGRPEAASEPGARTVVRCRHSGVGEGLQAFVYAPDQPDLFARICGYFEKAGFSILDAKVHTTRDGYALDTFQIVTTALPEYYRELINLVERGLAEAIRETGPLPPPGRGRVSRRVRSFPVAPQVELSPDDKAQRWLLTLSASDRPGLLYSVACVLARHRLNLHLAKISTLGERVEDTLVIDGAGLGSSKRQIAIETELMEVLAA
ncbi:MAG: [protein-PII] uridylyltransferase [Xylophilus ampelinus]